MIALLANFQHHPSFRVKSGRPIGPSEKDEMRKCEWQPISAAVRKNIRHSHLRDAKIEHEKDEGESERRTAYDGRATRVRRASAPACRGTRPCPAPAKRSPGDIDEGEKPGKADLRTH
jgi:hypothetical protein